MEQGKRLSQGKNHQLIKEYERNKISQRNSLKNPVKQSQKGGSTLKELINKKMPVIRQKALIIKSDPNFTKYKHTVCIGKGNNCDLIKEYFERKKWQINSSCSKQNLMFHLKWVQCGKDIPFDQISEGNQICNHISNISMFTSKTGFIDLIKEYENQSDYFKMHSSSFFPETFILNLDSVQMSKDEIDFINETKNEGIWIHKPWNLNCGGGIKMVGNLYKFKKELQKLKKESDIIKQGQRFYSEYFSQLCLKSVIQKYIDKPLLLNGKKFDIRCYILIASAHPLIVYYHPGYLRLSMQNYSTDNIEDEDQIYTHLTNAAIQKTHKDYEQQKEETIWSMDRFQQHCIENCNRTQEQMDSLEENIKKFMTYTIHMGEEKLSKQQGCFELMGIDILIDENFRPYLIEMNTNPAIDCDTKVKQDIIPNVVSNGLDMVIEINGEPQKKLQKIKNLDNYTQQYQGDYTLLINSQQQFSYTNFYQDIINKQLQKI